MIRPVSNLDYHSEAPARARPVSRAASIVARVAGGVSLVPWIMLVELKAEVASHEMGPMGGAGNILFSFVGTFATLLLLTVWIPLAAWSGWRGRMAAALALGSLALCWLVFLYK
jgi:hypothetical protein